MMVLLWRLYSMAHCERSDQDPNELAIPVPKCLILASKLESDEIKNLDLFAR